MTTYQVWLTDDAGKRLCLLDNFFYMNYTRTVSGFGAFELGMSYDELAAKVTPVFQVDRRCEVWRSPAEGIPMRLERSFIIRHQRVYTRKEDNITTISLYGRDGTDLLYRRHVIQDAGTSFASKTDYADDMMKAIVREQMLYGSCYGQTGSADNTRAYPNGEFLVEGDVSQGPSITKSFADANVRELLNEISDQTAQLAVENSTYHRIYFDCVESALADGTFGWEFRTFKDWRGSDKTTGVVFSIENGNMEAPALSQDHSEERNVCYVKGQGRGESRQVATVSNTPRIEASRWNRCEMVRQASGDADTTELTATGTTELNEKKPIQTVFATFLNTPGNIDKPRSLYGIDWDLGDLIPVEIKGIRYDCEIIIVYVTVHDDGSEEVYGRNRISEDAAV